MVPIQPSISHFAAGMALLNVIISPEMYWLFEQPCEFFGEATGSLPSPVCVSVSVKQTGTTVASSVGTLVGSVVTSCVGDSVNTVSVGLGVALDGTGVFEGGIRVLVGGICVLVGGKYT